MAVVYGEGFEDDAWDVRSSHSSAVVSTSYGTGGRRGVRVGDDHGARFSNSTVIPVASGGEDSIWWHFRLYVDVAGTQCVRFHSLGTDTQMFLYYTNSQWQLINYNGGTDSSLFGVAQEDKWYDFFIVKTYHASTGSMKVWINGALSLNLTSLNTGTIPTGSDLYFGGFGSTDVNSMWVMDIVMGDGSDSPSADYPYSLQAHTLLPTGNGTTSGLTGSDTNQTDNYLLVDESDPDNADYCGSATEGNKDTYAMGDLSSTTEGVLAVIGENIQAKSDSGAKYMRSVLRTASTDYVGTSVALSESYTFTTYVWDENPNTVSAWTGTEANGIEFGAEVRDS